MTRAGAKRGDIVADDNRAGSASAQMIIEDRASDDGPAVVVVVHVEETICPALAGHEGLVYESPPLPRTEALAVVRVLIGRDRQSAGEDSWRCPIAGGQRTITLQPAVSVATSANGRQSAIGARPGTTRCSVIRRPPMRRVCTSTPSSSRGPGSSPAAAR